MIPANLSCTLVHVDLPVADMERSVAFYTKSLGLLVLEDCTVESPAALFLSGGTCPKMRMVFLTGGGTSSMMVELIQFVADGDPSASAVAARRRDVALAFVVGDLAGAIRTLAADGQHTASAVIEIELTQLGPARVVFYRDPDGHLIELVEFIEAG